MTSDAVLRRCLDYLLNLLVDLGNYKCLVRGPGRIEPLAKNRILADPLEVVRRSPDIIIASWCGRKFRASRILGRPGWENVPALANGELHDIDSTLILQPGPAALTDGLDALVAIIDGWVAKQRPP